MTPNQDLQPGGGVRVRQVFAENVSLGRQIDGLTFTGPGRDVIVAIEQETGVGGIALLESIVNRLLVKKGADWTSAILSEYVGLYDDSLGTFSLVWDRATKQLVSHGSIFQSANNPTSALLAHIRTADEFKGLGLGTLVTEEVTATAFRQGAKRVVLATDDKLHRVAQGERAAHSMYARMGYTILAEKRLADAVDWLMIVDEPTFSECQRRKTENGGKFSEISTDDISQAQKELVQRTRELYSQQLSTTRIEQVRAGDLAHLFVLLNLYPERDFHLKLNAWGIHHGPETERQFITSVRPAIADRDRLDDASLAIRSEDGEIVAVCAAQQVLPFTRATFAIDFYCLPQFLQSNETVVTELVRQTIARIEAASHAPRPCRLAFAGIDEAKTTLFRSLGFTESGNTFTYHDGNTGGNLEAQELAHIIK